MTYGASVGVFFFVAVVGVVTLALANEFLHGFGLFSHAGHFFVV